jgi:hypothetical protein
MRCLFRVVHSGLLHYPPPELFEQAETSAALIQINSRSVDEVNFSDLKKTAVGRQACLCRERDGPKINAQPSNNGTGGRVARGGRI